MEKFILDLLKKEVKPAVGCTEPVAIALCVAKAKEVLGDEKVRQVDVYLGPNIYKNALAVGIPNSTLVGLDVAASLGLSIGNSSQGLELLKNVDDNIRKVANDYLLNNTINIHLKDTSEKIYIESVINDKVKVIIQGEHDHYALIQKNDICKLNDYIKTNKATGDKHEFYSASIHEIIDVVDKISDDKLDFMLDGVTMNMSAAIKGLNEKMGAGIGYTLFQALEKDEITLDLPTEAMYYTAAASDARMSGDSIPIMSSNGSGNNGITAIIPVVIYCRQRNIPKEKLAKAIAISHVINSYIKNQIGRLSAVCSCAVSAGTSAAVAITYLKEGNTEAIDHAINNMIANLSGMICDGAKDGCAMKLATAASTAVYSAILASNKIGVKYKNGIIGKTPEESIKNLGIISQSGMDHVDENILEIMNSYY